MSDIPPPLPLSPAEARHVDQICDRFEAAWKAGPRPHAEEYLGTAVEPVRSALLRQLLLLDWDYRRRAGDDPRAGDYHARFPEATALIEAVDRAITELPDRTDGESDGPHGRITSWSGTSAPDLGGEAVAEEVGAARYELLQEVGHGGIGVVYRGRDRHLGRELAVKVLGEGHRDNPDARQRFTEEARVGSQLQHPAIVPVYEQGWFGDRRPYFTMKLVEGHTLAALLHDRTEAGEELPRWLGIFEQVCQAMAYAHARGVVHRDLKPANVMVGAFGEVQVMDWGFAKVLGEDGAPPAEGTADSVQTGRVRGRNGATQSGALMGTPAYMPPEQARGEIALIDARTDVFALGAILCEILTRWPPYGGSTADEVCRKAAAADLQEAHARLNDCGADEALCELARRCLAAERPDRPPDAGVVAQDVIAYLTSAQERLRQAELNRAAAEARAEEARAKADAERRARRLTLTLATAAVVILLSGIVGTTWGLLEAWRQRQNAEANAHRATGEEGKAKTALNRAEWLLYASQINLAAQAWDKNDTVRANDYLASCRPEFRGWEHDHLFTLFRSNQRTYGQPPALGAQKLICVAVSPDGKRIAAGSADKTVKLWDADTGREHTGRGHAGSVTSVAFSPDGKRLLSGSHDNAVVVWDVGTGRATHVLKGHTNSVTGVAWAPDGTRVVSGSFDRTLRVWDAVTGQESRTFKGHANSVTGVAWSPDGTRIVSGTLDGTVKVWDAETGQDTQTLKKHTDSVLSVAWSPDGRHIVSGSADQTMTVWDAQTGQETRTFKGHKGPVSCVAWGLDGNRIVSGGGWDFTVRLWDAETGDETRALRGHIRGVKGVALTSDGKRIVSASEDNTVKVWDAAVGQEPRALKGHTGGVRSVALSPDGKRIVSGGSDNTVKVWDAVTGEEVLNLSGHGAQVSTVAVTPNGKRIVSGSHDQTVKVWEADTGHETLTLKGHTSAVNSVAVSCDGKRLISASTDGTMKVWDASMSQQKP